jgi:hypothetical protein
MANFNIRIGKNIWDNETGMFLIPVNCVGVMGCGLAKQCKVKFPEVYKDYRNLCKSGKFILNTLKLYVIKDDYAILLVPTKYDWRHPSELEWVEKALETLGSCLERSHFDTLHVPPLGCGAGGLDVDVIRPLVEKHLCHPDVSVYFYQ